MDNQVSRIQLSKVLFPLGLGTALSLLGDATLYAVLPTHTSDVGISLGAVGIILGVNRAIRLFTNGPAGLAYDRRPRRQLFVPALFVGALSTGIYAVARGFWPLFVGRLLWGVAWSGIWVGGATMILDVSTGQDRGRWTGLYQTWFFLGLALGSFGGGLLTDWLGYTKTMWVAAALTTLGGLVALFLLPETRNIHEKASVVHRGEQQPPDFNPPLVEPRWLSVRTNGLLWFAICLQGINRFAVSGVLSATMGLLVRDRLQHLGVTFGVATLTGFFLAGRTLLSMLAAPLAGALSDQIGSRWTVAGWGLAAGLMGMSLLGWGVTLGIVAGVLLMAVSLGIVQSMATTLTGDLVGDAQRGQAIGLLYTVGDLGSAVGPSVAYALLPWINLRGVYLLCALLFAVGLILVVCRRSKQPTDVAVRCAQSRPDVM
jgi:DHA1 family multidrug resistance protein-like MFS transporter